MPRLVGKQSNHGLLTGVVLVAAITVAAAAVEYLGYTNIIPGWGRKSNSLSQLHPSVSELSSSPQTRTIQG